MSHFTTCAMVPMDLDQEPQVFLDSLDSVINEIFKKFDINFKIEPYKFYVDIETIERMARRYKIDKENFKELAEKMEDWDGNKGGVDDSGLYAISTTNPNGHIDAWEVSEVVPDVNDLLKEKFVAHAIVSPDGDWIASDTWFYSVGDSNQKEFDEWNEKFAALLRKYQKDGAVCVLVGCHI